MGYKLAELASKRRHIVTLISGPTRLAPPKVKKFISIERTVDLLKALKREIKRADCLIMCAAVGDFRVRHIVNKKIKRRKRLLLELVSNSDILKEISRHKKSKLFIGFSLETHSLIKNSYKKLKDKKLDIVIANRLSKNHNPFGDKKLDVCIINKAGHRIYINNKSKAYIARVLLDKIERLWYLLQKTENRRQSTE